MLSSRLHALPSSSSASSSSGSTRMRSRKPGPAQHLPWSDMGIILGCICMQSNRIEALVSRKQNLLRKLA